ncbi:MAG: anaerobic ribonucleoside-triphosphate reductase [Fusobacteriaceae bacterium]
MVVIKKDSTTEIFDDNKIILAVTKSANRIGSKISESEFREIIMFVEDKLRGNFVSVADLHNIVELALDTFLPEVAKSYKDFRNYKKEFGSGLMGDIESQVKKVLYEVDRENSNSNTRYISTKRTEIAKVFAKELYQKMFIPTETKQAMRDGYIYVHDLSDLILPQFNCLEGNTLVTIEDSDGVSENTTIAAISEKFDVPENFPKDLREFNLRIASRKENVKLLGISKRKVNTSTEKVFKIYTKNSTIVATDKHRIPVTDNLGKSEQIKEVKDIKAGEFLATRDARIHSTDGHINMFDVARRAGIELTIYIPKEIQYFIMYKYKSSIASMLNVEPKKINYFKEYLKLNSLQYESLNRQIQIPYEIFQNIKISSKGSKVRLPLSIEKSSNLALIISYVFADGSVIDKPETSSYQIIFTNTNLTLINRYREAFRDVFKVNSTLINPTGEAVCYRSTCGSRLLTALFKDLDGDGSGFGYKENAGNLSCPKFILDGSEDLKKAFLSGLIDTDGHISKDNFGYATSCEGYAKQVLNLFSKYLESPILAKRESKGTVYNIGNVSGFRNFDNYIIKSSRAVNIETLLGTMEHSLKCNKVKYEHTDNGGMSYSYDEILKIEDVTTDMFVYDLQTEDGWFIANNILVHNCCLLDVNTIIKGGFELEGIHYAEPKDIATAIGQLGDVIMIVSSQHFGGLTVPQIDKVLAPYYEMTILRNFEKYRENFGAVATEEYLLGLARKDAYRSLKQGLQGLEIKLNTVVSARGSYPFVSFSFGDCEDEFQEDVSKAVLEVRMEGHGKAGFKKSLIFPKLIFLHSVEKHGKGERFEKLFDISIKCSSRNMYPDYLGHNHKREGQHVSAMGCRAFLSNYRDPETGKLVFNGRFNIGANSLNLAMIYMKSELENLDFLETVEYYLQMIRRLHINRYEYLGKAKANSNPLMFEQGGAYGGFLKPDDNIAPLLKSATASFGITALHELSLLATGKSLREDNRFAMYTMNYIEKRVEDFKNEDGWLYAIYNTPSESLCGTQVKQFRAKYGIIERVSDKDYFTNSNHLWVGEEVTPFEKQDKEIELFKKSTGGHIGYVKISNPENLSGLKKIIERGLKLGFYQGVNFNACTCDDCGHVGNNFGDSCPKCKSENVNEINRVCGYLGFSKKRGDRTLNNAKMAEVKDRVSM